MFWAPTIASFLLVAGKPLFRAAPLFLQRVNHLSSPNVIDVLVLIWVRLMIQ